MPASTTADTSQAKAGLFGHLSTLLAAKLAYLKARLELAGIEGKEAAVHLAIIVGLAVVALVLVIFGYFFLVLFLVFLIGLAFGGNAWVWVMLGAAVIHLILAGVLLLVAKTRLGVPLFPLTLEELKKDQEWLKTNAKPN
ncbi:MAG TPA: phage holin family protein [Chthoniobacter sp.]|nr:phage holin family protein [Chthoniobacter sp.]